MFEVACVGILCADVLAKPVDKLPEKGKLNLIDKLQMQVGGCASNAAIDLAKIGVNVTMVGKVGDDGFGKFLTETLKAEKVNISGLVIDKSVQTSASVVTISTDAERSILHCLGSNSKFTFKDIEMQIVKNSKILFIAGTFLMPEFDGNGTEELLKQASENGVLCCMDTAWDSTNQWMNKIESSLKYLDWFLPSYEEAVQLSGRDEPDAIADVFKLKGVKNIVIKLGKDGCYVKPQNDVGFYVPTFNDIKVVDTSGAGDSFCAGFITGLVKGWDLKMCAKFANAVGSHCVMEIGTTTGVKSLKETLEFIKLREKN